MDRSLTKRAVRGGVYCMLTLAGAGATLCAAQSTDQVNAANNPLTPTITLNLQDQWAPRLYDTDDYTNSVLFRGVLPHALGGAPQMVRFTMPVVTAPTRPEGTVTSSGDLNLFNLFLFKHGNAQIGVGPQLTAPTAGNDSTGTGKWQAGLAGALIAPQT